MTVPDARLDAFLTEYGSALATMDAARSAALWGVPGTLVSDAFAASLDSREAMAEGLRQSYPLYRRLGLARVDHELVQRADLTDALVRVRVRWLFYDTSGDFLTDSEYEYVLRDDVDGLHAYVAIALDEQQKMAELLTRKGITLD